MPTLAVVDASPLLATLDRRDPDHAVCVETLGRRDLQLVIPALVVAEVAYLAGKRLGTTSEAAFVRGSASLDVETPGIEDWPIIAALVERYADMRLGTTDASIAVLAERLGTDIVITLDRRHFGAIRSPSGRAYHLLPESHRLHEEPAPYGATPP
jgi:uncharacterized protein